MIPLARSAHVHDLARRAQPAREAAALSFSWSPRKLASASLVLLTAAAPAAIGFAVSGSFIKWLCLGWLLAVAFFMHGLARRAADPEVVISIDRRGILDRRLMPRHLEWQDIAAICTVDRERSHVVDIALRRPDFTLSGTRWAVRLGALCQRGYDVPAVTISLLLLDGSVGDLLDSIALFRPELLRHESQR